MEEIARWTMLDEGQFFERKSVFDRSGARPAHLKVTIVAKFVAETLAAMANADGGELVVGIDDDRTVSGVPYSPDRVQLLLGAPGSRNYVDPPLRCQSRDIRTPEGLLLLHFAVDWSPEVHRLADGRYVRRVSDRNMPFPADHIAALKQTKAQGLLERSFPPGATLADVDLELVASLLSRVKMETTPDGFLRQYRLIEGRNGRSVPCLSGLLLFGRDPARWHPRCGIDFVRWEGTERRFGSELNIAKRIRLEHPLAILIEKAYEAVRPFIRERQQLQDLFFTERLEYPTFVWQEAIVNAVAHRDYGIQGACTEVWMFDDRMEVRSPGLPPNPVTIAALNRQQRVHLSRNPLIVRVLVALGYMRELGEGIPRMFAEMEREGFYPPRFEDVGGVSFQVTLRNQPVYDRRTLKWLECFSGIALSGDQKRLLVFAHAHGDRFTSRDYQRLIGLDLYAASNSIKDLIRKGVVRSLAKGSRVYEAVCPASGAASASRTKLGDIYNRLRAILGKKLAFTNEDVRTALKVSRPTATRVLNELCGAGLIERRGQRRWTRYRLRPRPMNQPQGDARRSETDS